MFVWPHVFLYFCLRAHVGVCFSLSRIDDVTEIMLWLRSPFPRRRRLVVRHIMPGSSDFHPGKRETN